MGLNWREKSILLADKGDQPLPPHAFDAAAAVFADALGDAKADPVYGRIVVFQKRITLS